MIYNNINIYKKCNVQPKYPIVTTSKFIADLEPHFSCSKRDVNHCFD